MMSNEKVMFVQKQTAITDAQIANLSQYAYDNCASEMWKDVFITELGVIHKRLSTINQICKESLKTPKTV